MLIIHLTTEDDV